MSKQTRGAKVIVKCKQCSEEFSARVADRKRGWGKFCSKSCKAKEQEKRTGQNAEFLRKKEYAEDESISSIEDFACRNWDYDSDGGDK